MRHSTSRKRNVNRLALLALLSPLSALAVPTFDLWSSMRSRSIQPPNPKHLSPRGNFSVGTPDSSQPHNYIYNVRPTLWVSQDLYAGQTFFDEWSFHDGADPTHGQVNYVTRDQAWGKLAYVDKKNKVVMTVDRWSQLPQGASRDSVRIQSNKVYNGGLFILDVEQAPFGCGVWPAFWTVGPNWPNQGEIDILEGVHDYVHNQVTFHTADHCSLTRGNFTGQVLQTDCYAYGPGGQGCGTVDPSQASYGPEFNQLGGGVFAMMWDVTGVKVWFFHRTSIPQDIVGGTPDPTTWGMPSAAAAAAGCKPEDYFKDHNIVFDITFCGDWAGGSSYIDAGCPGTCSDRIMNPANFLNASWSINYLHVFRDAKLSISGSNAAPSQIQLSLGTTFLSISLTALLFALSCGFVLIE